MDQELLQALIDGDSTAWSKIVDEHRAAMYLAALSIVRDEHLAEDCVQDAWISIIRAIVGRPCDGEGRPREALHRAYFLTAARNCAVRILSRKIGSKEVSLETTLRDGQHSLIEILAGDDPGGRISDQRHARERIGKALETLSDKEREVLELRYFSELSFREIGELLEEPWTTVRSRHDRALEKLRKFLDDDCA